ncbi:MAG: branched-chain-amino-acid transaminase [Gemmatimonadetes bacterium]|nr:branched-chain-amino-acid transaminase [Gemmatimonadota bacterium]MBP6667866.1 branched-chain-amino-acid transaminase [Gemmatimonadales bacterium]MBK6780104.1 branched-chain-amino-acid transaminase [Gemmatimonadota bacterium]MBK7350844.1 branched-chain-amino-acid transaminase [Gemmatimonadota bacterium]MBK7716742.1 branched-chain-amino-acid transaminase [Gemmatimonadota bacterium]
MTLIYLDGQWLDKASAKISVFDHGLLYGDGVFEGMRVYGGKTFKLAEHVHRLYDSAKAILLEVPMSREEMIRVTEEGVQRAGLTEGYLRHVITRGVGDLGLDPRKCPRASIIIIFDTIAIWPAERYEQGLTLVTAGTPINQREALSPRVKSLNYLNHIMAKVEATNAGADDAIMLDSAGHIAEATGMNLFVWKNGLLLTPPAYAGQLRGVTRDTIVELARQAGYPVQETMLNRYDLYTADEAFLTGTAAEVAPIRMVDGRLIGAGKAGPVTRDIRARFQQLVRR